MGNIRDEPFDPFPRDGLTRAFEPFIRKEAGRCCDQYRHVDRRDMLIEAVRLSVLAEARFDPTLGNSFATFVAYRLKELYRFAEQYDGSQKFRVVEDPAVRRRADERGGDPEPIHFRGGNGARLRFDWQWSVGDLVKRFRVVFGLQAGAGTNARELADRLGGARDALLNQRPTDRLNAYVAAVADHLLRRQREADSEAEKRRAGDHSPTFLEATPVTDVQFVRAKKPPRLDPEYAPVLRMTDAVGIDDDGHRLTWQEVIAAETTHGSSRSSQSDRSGQGGHDARREDRRRCCDRDCTGKAVRSGDARNPAGNAEKRRIESLQRMLAKVAGMEGNDTWI